MHDHSTTPVRLARCAHGTYFLSHGNATLSMTSEELILVARAIYGLAERHRPLFVALVAGIREEQIALQGGQPATAEQYKTN